MFWWLDMGFNESYHGTKHFLHVCSLLVHHVFVNTIGHKINAIIRTQLESNYFEVNRLEYFFITTVFRYPLPYTV